MDPKDTELEAHGPEKETLIRNAEAAEKAKAAKKAEAAEKAEAADGRKQVLFFGGKILVYRWNQR